MCTFIPLVFLCCFVNKTRIHPETNSLTKCWLCTWPWTTLTGTGLSISCTILPLGKPQSFRYSFSYGAVNCPVCSTQPSHIALVPSNTCHLLRSPSTLTSAFTSDQQGQEKDLGKSNSALIWLRVPPSLPQCAMGLAPTSLNALPHWTTRSSLWHLHLISTVRGRKTVYVCTTVHAP